LTMIMNRMAVSPLSFHPQHPLVDQRHSKSTTSPKK
jgi:hypothetical protein